MEQIKKLSLTLMSIVYIFCRDFLLVSAHFGYPPNFEDMNDVLVMCFAYLFDMKQRTDGRDAICETKAFL